jgi:hypothetical protein
VEQQDDFALAEKCYLEAFQIFEKLGEKPYLELAKKYLERVRQKKTGNIEK